MSVSHTVSEIFSIKERRDLETGVRGCSSSLKMTGAIRQITYDLLLVHHSTYSSIVLQLFDVE